MDHTLPRRRQRQSISPWVSEEYLGRVPQACLENQVSESLPRTGPGQWGQLLGQSSGGGPEVLPTWVRQKTLSE